MEVYIGSVRDVPLDFASRFCIVNVDGNYNNKNQSLPQLKNTVVCIVGSSSFCILFVLRPLSTLRCFLCGPKLSVSVRVPGGNEQMAHSQVVVLIAFSLTFEMDVALVFRRRPLGNVGFHCRFSIAVYHHVSRYVIVCFCLF